MRGGVVVAVVGLGAVGAVGAETSALVLGPDGPALFHGTLEGAGAGLSIAWPKKASKRPTDLTEDVVRQIALANTLVDNKVAAIDETWSGLRLVIRVRDRVSPSATDDGRD